MVNSAPDADRLAAVDHSGDDAYWKSVGQIIAAMEERAESTGALARLAESAASHAEWPVRAAAIRLLADHHLPSPAAAAAIAAATHDEVDWVAFTAIQLAGRYQIRSALPDLIKISGWPSNFTKPGYARKPVGCGAAFAKTAMLEILGSRDPSELRRLEDEHFAGLRAQVAARRRSPVYADVVLVPAGPFVAGASVREIGPFQMNDNDNELRTVELPAYYIDRCAVTNERYRTFLGDVADSRDFDHPDQEPGRDHRPSHWHDRRFNRPELPVVGIDWYDAWAFARWSGGSLPSEDEWEKAARGQDARIFPWGDDFDASRVNFVERAYGRPVPDLSALESLLITTDAHSSPAEPVLPADSLPAGASPYGLLHMAGNVWELTRTNFFSRNDMDPFFRNRRPSEFLNRKDAFHVLRGGTWTSPPACLTTFYRGKDLLTDRHNEVGFRCVYPVPG